MKQEKAVFSKLRNGALKAFSIKVLGVLLLLLMHSILGNQLGPENYGTFSYAISVVALLVVIVSLGWPNALMRFTVQYIEQKEWRLLRGSIICAHIFIIASASLTALGLWGISFWHDVVSSSMSTSLRFAALLLPLSVLIGLHQRLFQGLHNVGASIVPREILLPILVAISVFLAKVSNASEALLIYTGATLLSSIFTSTYVWKSLPKQLYGIQAEFRTREWLTVSLPVVFSGISQTIMNRTDVLMLGSMVDMQAVGFYSLAKRIALLNTFVMTAVNLIGAPMLASAFYSGNQGNFQAILNKTRIWCMLGALPLFSVIVVWPQGILNFFGDDFVEAASLLQIIALGQFINASTGLVGSALVMTGSERLFAWTVGATTLLNITGNLITIPKWGAIGAAWVTALSIAILNIWQLRLLHLRTKKQHIL